MKTKYIAIIMLGAQLAYTSCDDMGFLQIKPDSLELTDDRIKTVEDLDKLLLGAYNEIRSSGFYGGRTLRGFDVIADDGVADVATFEWVQMSAHTMNLVNAVGRDTWTATYKAINMVNQVAFSDLGESILSENPQKEVQFKAEASFIRAFGYFHLVRAFGLPYAQETKDVPEMGVPLRLRGVMDRVSAFEIVQRSSVKEVYSQIISDLEYAIAHLSETENPASGRATADGAKALLAKVYFYKHDFANAAKCAEELINTQKYDLDEDLSAKYARAEKKTITKETIMMIPSVSLIEDSWGGLRDYRTNGLALPTSRPSNALIAAYDHNNDRRFQTFYKNIDGLWYTVKFDYEHMDGIIMGYNELLLIYAESLAESDSNMDLALNALQKIEKRAYGKVMTVNRDKVTIIKTVQKERRLEIALQGERLFELKRLKQPIRGEAWDSHKVMFQIPDVEQNGNPDVNMN
ncbi:RagB/SusD family nutrient uptake outer membrane protein [Parabacteroides gordonii]|uniref:RagB/SusD family nutrient uptake outer membrane protein n=1 Tax=Parabacteroides gordonii TaxID=574930 RepID=UPI000EEB3C5F|nr:RagB/SusD family nutrient uptake outer membrane protein [Parabacteroides gordonii]RGP17821.1 RagB/SusD family nutrient uptake outer membrane protein [Parabacteroides gordonii]